jgi:hypothetical protein
MTRRVGADRRLRSRVTLAMVLTGAAFFCLQLPGHGYRADAQLGAGILQIEVQPGEAGPSERSIVVLITNTGDGVVSELTLQTIMPSGVGFTREGTPLKPMERLVGTLNPQGALVVRLHLTGEPAMRPVRVVFIASGRAEQGHTSAIGALVLTSPPGGLAVNVGGSDAMTDASPAKLTLLVSNPSADSLLVRVSVSAGRSKTLLSLMPDSDGGVPSPLCFSLGGHDARPVYVTVSAEDPIRKDKVLFDALVQATRTQVGPKSQSGSCQLSPGADVQLATATREISVNQAASEILPSIVGVSSSVLFPGLAFTLALLALRRWDKARVYPVTTSLWQEVWDNKLWLLFAAIVSLLIAFTARAVSSIDLLDAYSWSDLIVLTALAGVAGAVVFGVWIPSPWSSPRISSQKVLTSSGFLLSRVVRVASSRSRRLRIPERT